MQIHDEVFPRLASGQLPENSNALPRLLGVTNLYFLKALPSWPNVLSTGKRTVLQRSVSDGGLQVSRKLPAVTCTGYTPAVSASVALWTQRRGRQTGSEPADLRGAGPAPG